MKFPLFPYSRFTTCLETYCHDMRHAYEHELLL
jgi:hypothetical protein